MVIGQYEIIEKIGEGGMGVIYKGVHSILRNTVAIKALPSSLSSNTEIRERFIREATIQARISHPNIVNIHNFFEFEGNYYIVMEYVEGETVEAMIKRLGLIPPDLCLSLFEQIAAGIQYAHDKGIIHRDMKPANIMVNTHGVVKIMDFGIAKMDGDLNLTRAGAKVGTVWYMSPEQIKGAQASVATDIYSLGVTLFEMVTGRVPFYADSEYNVMKTIVESTPSSPKIFYPYIPEPMEGAILKAMAKNPAERFRSAAEFATALSQPSSQPNNQQQQPQQRQQRQQPQHAQQTPSGGTPAAVRPAAAPRKFNLSSKQGMLLGAGLMAALILVVFAATRPDAPAPQAAESTPAIEAEVQAEVVPPSHPDAARSSGETTVLHPAPTAPPPASKAARDATGDDSDSLSTSASVNVGVQPKVKAVAEGKRESKEIRRYLAKGAQHHEDGNFPEARAMFSKVLRLDPGNEAAHTGIRNANRAEKALKLR